MHGIATLAMITQKSTLMPPGDKYLRGLLKNNNKCAFTSTIKIVEMQLPDLFSFQRIQVRIFVSNAIPKCCMI